MLFLRIKKHMLSQRTVKKHIQSNYPSGFNIVLLFLQKFSYMQRECFVRMTIILVRYSFQAVFPCLP